MTAHVQRETQAQMGGPVPLVESETELTTAATDALLGLVCLGLAAQLMLTPVHDVWKRNLWLGVLLLTASGSVLGAAAHGVVLADAVKDAVWKPLYLSLGLAVALIFVAALRDGVGEGIARSALPWALGAGVAFFAATQLLGGAFVWFIAYEAVAIVTALGVYGTLAVRGGLPGAPAIALGIALSLVAAVVQVSPLSARVVVRFDHNGLFHLIQLAGLVAIAVGVRTDLAGR